jgi:hypothetical protein
LRTEKSKYYRKKKQNFGKIPPKRENKKYKNKHVRCAEEHNERKQKRR